MPSTSHHVDRLSLTFRAEDPAPPRSSLPGGWWLWCLLGVGIGLGGWLLSRQYLAEKLGERLLTSKSRPEAMVALEGLLLLDSTASHAIVSGLQHEDFAVARAAFRAIESQIERWQDLAPAAAKTRMQVLAESLLELPDTIPSENRILASSLASRIFTMCLEREGEDMKPIMLACEQVLKRGSPSIADEPNERIASLTDTNYSLTDTSTAESAEAPVVDVPASEFTDSFAAPLITPPAPLPPDASKSNVRSPQLIDPTDGQSMSLDSNQPLSSAGGRGSLRLITSQVNAAPVTNMPRYIGDSQDQMVEGVQPPPVEPEPMTLPPSNEEFVEDGVELPRPAEPSAQTLAGIEQLSIQQLVRLLASTQPKITQAASLALRRQGMSDSKLDLAMRLANGSEQQRLEIIDQFPSRTDIDPRVWLLWMAQDGQTEVRARAVAQLSSMLDNDVMRELRLLLNRERDPEIAQMIRKLLMSR